MERWLANRIGYSERAVWRYDAFGNRIAQYRTSGEQQRLGYDGTHRLVQLERTAGLPADGHAGLEGTAAQSLTATYTYDALGRRLRKHIEYQDGRTKTRYYGWDGDRLVHTEICRPEVPREQIRTIYLPGSFTPLVRLSREAGEDDEPTELLHLLAGSGSPDESESVDEETFAAVRAGLAALPNEARQALADTLKQVARSGLPASATEHLGPSATRTKAGLERFATRLAAREKAQADAVRIHHYHTNHLGTPLALTDEDHRIVWAAALDPWGNLEAEYNPGHLDQPIRLPGQHYDPESGYHYNRYRDYDPPWVPI